MRKALHLKTEELLDSLDALPKREQKKAFLRLVRSPKIQAELEDLLDLAVAEARRDEPTEPMEDVFAEMRRRRAAK